MQHQRLCRELQLSTGTVQLHPVARDETFQVDGETLRAPFGPGWRILGIGARQLRELDSDQGAQPLFRLPAVQEIEINDRGILLDVDVPTDRTQ